MINEPDPRRLQLVQRLDQERQRREKAEKQATALRSVITRLQRERQRTVDAKPPPDHHVTC